MANQLDCLLQESGPQVSDKSKERQSGTGEEAAAKVVQSYDSLCKQIRGLPLPLTVNSLQGISPIFRGAEVIFFFPFFFPLLSLLSSLLFYTLHFLVLLFSLVLSFVISFSSCPFSYLSPLLCLFSFILFICLFFSLPCISPVSFLFSLQFPSQFPSLLFSGLHSFPLYSLHVTPFFSSFLLFSSFLVSFNCVVVLFSVRASSLWLSPNVNSPASGSSS